MKVKRGRIDNFKSNMLLIIAAFLLTVFLVSVSAYFEKGLDLRIGQVSPTRFIAPVQVENTIATNRKRAAAADSVKEIYKENEEVTSRIYSQLRNFFDQVFQLRQEAVTIFVPYGVNSGNNANVEPSPTQRPSLSVYLTDAQLELLMEMDTVSFNKLWDNLTSVLKKIMEQGVRGDSVEKSLVQVRDELMLLNYSGTIHSLGYEIISSFLEPNLFVDEEATQKAKEEKAADVAPVIFQKGEKIVDEHDIITEEIYAVLNALDFTKKEYVESIIPAIGAVLIIIIVFFISMLYMYYFHREVITQKKEMLLLFTLYAFIISISRLMIGLPYLFMPVLIFTMLVSMLINSRVAVVLNIGVTIITMLIVDGDYEYLMFFMLSGTAVALFSRYTTERNKVMLVGSLLSFVNVCVVTGMAFFFEVNYVRNLMDNALYALLAGLFTVILSMGSLPFWEAVFGIITPVKLMDLTNPDSELLRRLTIEAPGTYHHCLIVANLSETAAYDINANPSLARAGGYYHDVGKLKYPQYFAENQLGENPHVDMDPYSSVQVIVSHVSYGMEIADTYKLPKMIRDIIYQHHGTTLIKYFYYSAKKANPDIDYKESDFRYPCCRPQSREAAVVMLADTVEAAVRSMIPTGKPTSEVEEFVRTLIKDKLDDGQLLDSGLTIKDMDTITHSFMRVFKGMYHERIPYPKAPVEKDKE